MRPPLKPKLQKPIKVRKIALLLAVVTAQIGFAYSIRNIRPELTVLEEPPSHEAMKITSLGDEEFYFRILGLELQNAGDTFGRFTSLMKYDYARLERWFFRLDELDSNSDWAPSLAGYYYSMTPKAADNIHIVNYLEKHADLNPGKNWWWYAEATYIANHKLNDKDRALELAYKLADAPNPDKPIWAREMPAFIHEQRGELEDSYRMIKSIAAEYDKLSPSEQKFISYFLKERLKAVKDAQKAAEELKPAK